MREGLGAGRGRLGLWEGRMRLWEQVGVGLGEERGGCRVEVIGIGLGVRVSVKKTEKRTTILFKLDLDWALGRHQIGKGR